MRSPRLILLWLLAGAFLLVASACAPEPVARHTPAHVSQTPDPARSLALPTPLPVSTQLAPAPSALPGPDAEAPEETLDAAGAAPALRYRVQADLDWTARRVAVEEWIDFHNRTGAPLREIVFSVDINGDPDRFALKRLEAGAGLELHTYSLDDTRLTVSLPQPLAPEGLLTLRLSYDLAVPPIADGYRFGHLGYLGYSDRQLNLGNWLPLVAHHDPVRGWICPLPHTVGEHAARPLADFDVTLRVKGMPEGLSAVAPGAASGGKGEWRFELTGAREMTISLSDRYEVQRATAPSGAEVVLYTFAEPGRSPDAAQHALQTATNALGLFEKLFDQPYRHERLIVVEGDFPDGMEFSGLVFVSKDWFRAWQGVPNDWLTLITAHEVAHQWWYSVVGSDQGNSPYLDEALAIYSELLYFERFLPEHVAWWWDFRVGAYEPSGFVDSPVYDFHSPRAYINAIYLQGARMMQSLREDLGDLAFFGWLQRYANQMQGQLATPYDFWGALTGDEYAATLGTRQRYLRNANVLARSSDLP